MNRKDGFKLTFKVHWAGCIAMITMILLMQSVEALTMILALTLHEMGHVFMMMMVGASFCTIEITPFGGVADVSNYEQLSTVKQVMIGSGGIVINLVSVWLSISLCPMTLFWTHFVSAHMILALFNGLPAWPLDGGRILVSLARRFGQESLMLRITSYITYLLSILILALGCYGAWHGVINVSLFMIPPYLCYAVQMSTVMATMKQMERLGMKNRKLMNCEKLPIKMFAWGEDQDQLRQYQTMRQLPNDFYHLFVTIDAETGEVQTVETETSISRRLFQNDRPQKPL